MTPDGNLWPGLLALLPVKGDVTLRCQVPVSHGPQCCCADIMSLPSGKELSAGQGTNQQVLPSLDSVHSGRADVGQGCVGKPAAARQGPSSLPSWRQEHRASWGWRGSGQSWGTRGKADHSAHPGPTEGEQPEHARPRDRLRRGLGKGTLPRRAWVHSQWNAAQLVGEASPGFRREENFMMVSK